MSVFVNRILNLRKIKVIGVDMDHTLVAYQTERFEGLAFRVVLQKLVELKGYPDEILSYSFKYKEIIQGLVIDKKRGNLLKLSRFGKVKSSYHGARPLDYKEQNQIYNNTVIDLAAPQIQALDTLFSLANGLLYQYLVDLRDRHKIDESYQTIAEDVKDILDLVHMDGSIKDKVQKNPEDYLLVDPLLAPMLERQKASGKKLLVITNSDYTYTRFLLDFSLNPYLKKHSNWEDLFDLVIVGAQKPKFFNFSSHFLKVDPATGLMSNFYEKLEKGIFQGGWAGKLQSDLGLMGDEILYVGDHIYGDVVSLKKAFNWRTALVLAPLEEELGALDKGTSLQVEIDSEMDKKEILEKDLNELFDAKEKLSRDSKKKNDESRRQELQQKIDLMFSRIEQHNQKISKLLVDYKNVFNPYWGEIMRAGQEESMFAGQVEKYACIYMTRLAQLLEVSPRTYFRPRRRMLPHERT